MQADLLRADASARVRLRRQRACAPALSYAADCWHEDDWVDKAGALALLALLVQKYGF